MALVRPGHCRELSVGTKIAGIGPETAEELRDKECDQKTIPFLYYRLYYDSLLHDTIHDNKILENATK